jgi:hypothetical protein
MKLVFDVPIAIPVNSSAVSNEQMANYGFVDSFDHLLDNKVMIVAEPLPSPGTPGNTLSRESRRPLLSFARSQWNRA